MVSNHIDEINKLKLTDNFKCELCQGYIIDATTISDCLHTFCKACIVLYLEDQQLTKYKCPTCEKTIKNPQNCIHHDAKYQRVIYKFVPNLLKDEILRRKQFYIDLIEDNNKTKANSILTDNSMINLKLSYEDLLESKNDYSYLINNIRYIQCLSKTPLRIIEKLLRSKYNIYDKYKIKFKYMDQELDNLNETFLEMFICFILNKDDLFDLKYTINTSKEIQPRKRLPNGRSKSLMTETTSHDVDDLIDDDDDDDDEKDEDEDQEEMDEKKMKSELVSSNEKRQNQINKHNQFLKVKLKRHSTNNLGDMKLYHKNNNNNNTQFIKRRRGRPPLSANFSSKTENKPILPNQPQCIKIIQINTTSQYLETSIQTDIMSQQPHVQDIKEITQDVDNQIPSITSSDDNKDSNPLDLTFKKVL